MESKTVAVTGSTGGISFYSAQEIARLGARVIIAGIWRTTWNGGHWQLTMTTALCLTALKSAVPASGDTFAHLIDDEYKHLNTLREHGGFHKTLLEGRTLKHFHVYIKEGDASQWSVLPHVDNGAFLLLTKTLDIPGMERSRFVLEDAEWNGQIDHYRESHVNAFGTELMRSEGAEVNCKQEMIALYNEQTRDLLAQTQMEELRCMEAVEQACLAQETELETAGAQQSEELCRVTDDHDRVVSEVEYLHELLLQQELAALTCESRSVQKFRSAEVDQERLQAELHKCQASCFELSSLHLHVAQREEDLRTLEIQRDQFREEVETMRCIEEEEGRQHHELETSALDHLQRLEGQLHDAQSQLGTCQSQESVLQTMEARFNDEMLVLCLDRDAVRFDNE